MGELVPLQRTGEYDFADPRKWGEAGLYYSAKGLEVFLKANQDPNIVPVEMQLDADRAVRHMMFEFVMQRHEAGKPVGLIDELTLAS